MSWAVGVVVVACVWARGADWPQWRGPNLNGSSEEVNLPEKLDPGSNMLWCVEMPGHGAGTPIVWGERVFVGSVDKKTDKLVAICVDRKGGKIAWQREVGLNSPRHGMNDMASPSAITDGKLVYFSFGTGDLAAFDMEGNILWSRNLQKDHGPFNMQFLYGSSPVLYWGRLYVQVLHRDRPYTGRGSGAPADSYVLAIDAATGKDIWKQIRQTDARDEAKEAYGTPLPYEGGGRKEVVVAGGDWVTGHDAESGKELWRCDGWNPTHIGHLRMVPSVTAAGELLIVCTPKVMGQVMAIRAGGTGTITETHVEWRNRQVASDVCNPLYYRGELYVLDGDFKKGLSCLDTKTGARKWFTALSSGRVFRTSPTGADGKVYIMNEAAEVWVLSASDGKVLSQSTLETEGTARASISVAQGCVFVRTGSKLYAFAATGRR